MPRALYTGDPASGNGQWTFNLKPSILPALLVVYLLSGYTSHSSPLLIKAGSRFLGTERNLPCFFFFFFLSQDPTTVANCSGVNRATSEASHMRLLGSRVGPLTGRNTSSGCV